MAVKLSLDQLPQEQQQRLSCILSTLPGNAWQTCENVVHVDTKLMSAKWRFDVISEEKLLQIRSDFVSGNPSVLG